MKGLEFAIIRYGYIWGDLAFNIALPFYMSKNNHDKYGEMCRLPGNCILIKHPTQGYMMYDVGEAMSPNVVRPLFSEEINPVEYKREDLLDQQLIRNGLSIDDISIVLISHMHWDHANGLEFFSNTKAGQNVYVPRPDFIQACESAMTNDDQLNSASGYWRSTLTIPGLKINLVDEDAELFPGVHVFLLEGHTAGVMGVLLECEEKNYLFPSDACAMALNYGPPARPAGVMYDSLGYFRCIKKLNALQKKYDATIIFSHDREQDLVTKKFPEFYK